MDEELLCDCGDCRYCNAHGMSDVDYDSCWRCNGAGCGTCEAEKERDDECADDQGI